MNPLISVEPDRKVWNMVPMSTRRVLVIDDEPDVRAVVRGCLEDIGGWDVTTAESGQDALVKAVADPPDAIVLDVMMPGMDGLAFLKALRNYASEATFPVVLLTAKITLNESDELSELGVKGVITKPFDPFLLIEQFANFVGWQLEE